MSEAWCSGCDKGVGLKCYVHTCNSCDNSFVLCGLCEFTYAYG